MMMMMMRGQANHPSMMMILVEDLVIDEQSRVRDLSNPDGCDLTGAFEYCWEYQGVKMLSLFLTCLCCCWQRNTENMTGTNNVAADDDFVG